MDHSLKKDTVCKITVVGGDLRRSLVQPPTWSKVSCEIRLDCLGLCPFSSWKPSGTACSHIQALYLLHTQNKTCSFELRWFRLTFLPCICNGLSACKRPVTVVYLLNGTALTTITLLLVIFLEGPACTNSIYWGECWPSSEETQLRASRFYWKNWKWT